MYKFVRNEKVKLERDPTQIAEVAALRATQGDEFIHNLIQPGHLSLKEKLNSATQNLLFKFNEFSYDRNARFNQAFSWSAYESYRPDVVHVEVPTQLNTSAHNLIKYEKEKIAAQKFGMTRDQYINVKGYIQDNNIKVKGTSGVISAYAAFRNENLEDINPNLETQNKFTNEQIDALESGKEVVNSGDHSVYAAA